LRLIPAFHPQHRFEALFHHGDTESRRKADHPESQNSFFLVAVLPAADPLREKREKLGTRFVDARTTACEYSLGPCRPGDPVRCRHMHFLFLRHVRGVRRCGFP